MVLGKIKYKINKEIIRINTLIIMSIYYILILINII